MYQAKLKNKKLKEPLLVFVFLDSIINNLFKNPI